MTDFSSSRQFAMLILRILVYLSYAMLLATSEHTYLYVYFFFYIECIGFVWSERGLKVTARTFKSHFRKYVSVVHIFTISLSASLCSASSVPIYVNRDFPTRAPALLSKNTVPPSHSLGLQLFLCSCPHTVHTRLCENRLRAFAHA